MSLPIHPGNLSRAASRLYEQWQHLEVDGEAEGWPWAVLAAACAAPVDDLYDLLTAADVPWAPAFDPELALRVLHPEFAGKIMRWAGQFRGVRSTVDLPPESARLRLQELSSFAIGTPGAITAAARLRAVGPDGKPDSATVILLERIGGDPYHFAVTMYASEVPDPAATRRDIEAVTPAGRFGTDPGDRFDFNLVTGGTYDTLRSTHATYDDMAGLWTDYADLRTDPGRV